MIDAAEVARLAADLRRAERSVTPVDLLTDRHPGFTWKDARAVARATDRLRADEGDTMIGYKLGWTSAAMRDALGIDRPSWGTLWDSQVAADGLVAHELIHPKIEPELVYRVPPTAAGVVPDGPEQVAEWNGEWALGIEVVDPRFPDYGFRWLDSNGHQNRASASLAAATASTTSTKSSTAATRAATVVRASQRLRHASTSTSFSGIRARKANIGAAPSANPGQDHANRRPSRTGSSVRLQPPCSVGIARATEIERRAQLVLTGEVASQDWAVVRQRLAESLGE